MVHYCSARWYNFTPPFIAERYIPVEVRLDFYGLSRLVNKMSQDKLTGDMLVKNDAGDVILSLGITDGESTLDREPGAVD